MSAQPFLRRHLERLLRGLSPNGRLLGELRAAWARTGTKDGWFASRYFDLTRSSAVGVVDDRTWNDLEYPKLFSDIDAAVTPIGSQTLYAQLRTYVDDPDVLSERYAVYQTLRSDAALREALQLKLAHLRGDSNAHIAEYVFGEPPGGGDDPSPRAAVPAKTGQPVRTKGP